MATPFHLNHKTVLVTGASSGIGKQVAIECSKMGARVVITGRNTERLHDTFKKMEGEGHSQISCDLTDNGDLNKFTEKLPLLDGIVHSAGMVLPVPAKFTEEKHIAQLLGLNFNIPALLTGKLLKNKKLNDNSSIVFLSSVAVNYPYTGSAIYSASKGAIEAYSKNLALELHTRKIRSNCLVLSMVNTPIFQETIKQGMHGSNVDEYASKYLLGIGEPQDVAYAVVYLLSEASRWVTGTNMVVDGGYSILK